MKFGPMTPALRRTLLVVGGIAGLLLLVALAVPLFANLDHYKPRFEAAATDALGMDVRIAGRLGIGFFPSFHVTAGDGRILGDRGVAVATARRVRLAIEPLSLLRNEIRVRGIDVVRPHLSIERDSEGRLNVERLKKSLALIGSLDRARVSVSNGTLHYADARSGEEMEAVGFDLSSGRLRVAEEKTLSPLRRLSLSAKFSCARVEMKNVAMSDLKATISGKGGVFQVEPIAVRLFGARAVGSVRVDATDSIPGYQVRCSLPGFRIEQFLAALSPARSAEGAMDFSATLTMRGGTGSRLIETAAGDISLRGRNLTLAGHDLDGELSRYESSQNFNLVDVGAIFVAGPLGLAVTKGYSFGSLFRGSGGTTHISVLVSDWRLERGVAQAKDVAMATPKNRLALQGGLDLVSGRFADMTVGVVDDKGCATMRQAMRGPFGEPEVEKPHFLKSLTGPVRKLVREAADLLPGGPCEVFYSGSVAHPEG